MQGFGDDGDSGVENGGVERLHEEGDGDEPGEEPLAALRYAGRARSSERCGHWVHAGTLVGYFSKDECCRAAGAS